MNRGGKSCVDFNPMQDLLGHRVSFSHPAREFPGIESARRITHTRHQTPNNFHFPFARVVKFPEIERPFIRRETDSLMTHTSVASAINRDYRLAEHTQRKRVANRYPNSNVFLPADNSTHSDKLPPRICASSPTETRHVASNADPTIQNDPMAKRTVSRCHVLFSNGKLRFRPV